MSTAETRAAILRGDYYERNLKPLVREDKVRPPFRSQDWGPKMDSILAKHGMFAWFFSRRNRHMSASAVRQRPCTQPLSRTAPQDDIDSLLGEQP